MLTICPNCRHPYENLPHSACQPCYKEKIRGSKPMGLSSKLNLPTLAIDSSFDFDEFQICSAKQKQHRLRKFLSGGSVVRTESTDKTRQKPNDNGHSPTSSLSFIIPPESLFAACDKLRIIDEKLSNSFYTSEDDLHKIAESQNLLKQSGWYHPKLSWKSAIELLMPTPVGTFLVRDSSDSNYLYSLSIQTKCGPTSIRIHYSKGEFRLDADHNVSNYLPKFPCLIKLIQYYVDLTKNLPLMCKQDDENQNWLNFLGEVFSQIVISRPLYNKGHVPSLKHLSRLCVNQNLVDANFRSVLPAPSFVISYLDKYPYKI